MTEHKQTPSWILAYEQAIIIIIIIRTGYNNYNNYIILYDWLTTMPARYPVTIQILFLYYHRKQRFRIRRIKSRVCFEILKSIKPLALIMFLVSTWTYLWQPFSITFTLWGYLSYTIDLYQLFLQLAALFMIFFPTSKNELYEICMTFKKGKRLALIIYLCMSSKTLFIIFQNHSRRN